MLDSFAELREVIACGIADGMRQFRDEQLSRGGQAARSRNLVLALGRVEVDLTVTGDRVVGGSPAELLVVESGGHPGIVLTFELEEGERTAVAMPGSSFSFPFKKVRANVPSTPALEGTMTLWIGPKDSYRPGLVLSTLRQALLGDAVVVSVPTPLSGAAIAGNVVSTLDGVAGFEYELRGLAVELDTDATVANRLVTVDVYDEDGLTIAHTLVYDLVTANQLGHHFAGPGGGFPQNVESANFTMGLATSQEVAFATGQANTRLLRVTVSAGVAGDTYKVRAIYRRRALVDE